MSDTTLQSMSVSVTVRQKGREPIEVPFSIYSTFIKNLQRVDGFNPSTIYEIRTSMIESSQESVIFYARFIYLMIPLGKESYFLWDNLDHFKDHPEYEDMEQYFIELLEFISSDNIIKLMNVATFCESEDCIFVQFLNCILNTYFEYTLRYAINGILKSDNFYRYRPIENFEFIVLYFIEEFLGNNPEMKLFERFDISGLQRTSRDSTRAFNSRTNKIRCANKNNNIRCLKLFMQYENLADTVVNHFLRDQNTRLQIAEELGFEGTRKGRLLNIFCAEKVDIGTFKSFISTLEYIELKRKILNFHDFIHILTTTMTSKCSFILDPSYQVPEIIQRCVDSITNDIHGSSLEQAIIDCKLDDVLKVYSRNFISFLVHYIILINTPATRYFQSIPKIVTDFIGPKGYLVKKYGGAWQKFNTGMRVESVKLY